MSAHRFLRLLCGAATATALFAPALHAASIRGRILAADSGLAVPGVTVSLAGPSPASTTTSASGEYEFVGLAEDNWEITPRKSGSWQAGVSSFDAARVFQDVADGPSLDAQRRLACDSDGNGALEPSDGGAILEFRVGLISRFASAIDCASDWVFFPAPASAANQSTADPQLGGSCHTGSIAYQTLQGDVVDQDFHAVLLGDCSGNWPGGIAAATPTATPTITPTTTSTATVTATPTRAFDWPEIAPTLVASGFTRPLLATHAGDGSDRLFIVEQGGVVSILRNGTVEATPFLDISSRVSCCGERGLLGLAFPAGYSAKRYFYVNYTNTSGTTVVARYHLTADDDVADFASEEILLTITQPFDNHNGGQIAFSPVDGFLYVAVGDGGSGGDPQNNAQDLDTLLGKILRIDVEGPAVPYGVPGDNPFVGVAGHDEIWALGLRNPFRFSFDRQTGDLYVGDVGQGSLEEIDFQSASSAGGENYGWRIMEGSQCFNPNPCDPSGLVLPVVDYNHGLGCSVTGGFVYRGSAHARMQGVYFYGDFCSGRLWGLKRDNGNWYNTLLLDTGFNVSSFGEDEEGELYVVDLGGSVYRIDDT